MQEKKIHHIVVGDIATNCWIYPLDNACANGQPDGQPCAVIDPGDEGSRIIAFLDQHKLYPAYIILTHGHFDHIGAVPALAAEYRRRHADASSHEDVTIAIHAAEKECLGPDSYPVHLRSVKAAFGDSAYIDTIWQPQPPADKLLEERDTVGPFTVLHLPGHSPGSIGLWDKKAGILFSGDTLFCGDYGRTDLPGGDSKLLFTSLKRLFSLDGGIQVYPGHGPITSILQESNLQM